MSLPATESLAQNTGAAARPELFVLVDPGRAHVQQQIVQRIRLQSPEPFDALEIDIGKIADTDAEVIELQVPATRRFESWGVRGYVYETARALFPAHSGTFALPPVSIQGRLMKADGTRISFTNFEPARVLEISSPEPTMSVEPWLAASEVNIAESWSTPPGDLRTGDIVQRTIDVQAVGVSGERIPELVMPVSQGISLLPGTVTRRTSVTEDGLIGYLTQTFDIRIDTQAVTYIAPLQLAWWNVERQRSDRSTVRAWRIEPLASDALARAERLMSEAASAQYKARRSILLLLATLLATLLLIGLVVLRKEQLRGKLTFAWRRIMDQLLGPRLGLPTLDRESEDPGKNRPALGRMKTRRSP